MKRRAFLAVVAASSVSVYPQSPRFQPVQDIRPLLEKLTGGATPAQGGIDIELPQIAENGNSVPMRVRVASPREANIHIARRHHPKAYPNCERLSIPM